MAENAEGWMEESEDFSHLSQDSKNAYDACAIVIFLIVTVNFLFPCNKILPLDRRTVAVLGAVLCYVTRAFAFGKNRRMDLIQAIDFDVLVLLASIMAINFLVVHLKESKVATTYIQDLMQRDPKRGFWLVSFAAFIISAFLTNDGVCLLFVEPILKAFEVAIEIENAKKDDTTQLLTQEYKVDESEIKTADPSSENAEDFNINDLELDSRQLFEESKDDESKQKTVGPFIEINTNPTVPAKETKLETIDMSYFLLTLACSANIGSALTYTGNPQNMIVAQDAVSVMSPLKFLLFMIVPSTTCWLLTTVWILRCWDQAKIKQEQEYDQLQQNSTTASVPTLLGSVTAKLNAKYQNG